MTAMRRIASFPWVETACVLLGGVFVGVMPFVPPLPVSQSVMIMLMGIASVAFASGLVLGVRRHRDVAPVLFGVTGLLFVVVGYHVLRSGPLTILGGCGVLLAAVWSVALQSMESMQAKAGVPTFEEFLDAPLKE